MILDELILWTARRKYKRQHLEHRGTKAHVSFDRLVELFGNDCTSFADIAREFGITRERVRQIYQQYFTRVFPNRSGGRVRRKLCALKTNAVRKGDFSSGVPQLLTRIAEIVCSRGYVCNKIPKGIKGNYIAAFKTSSLSINGKICGVHCLMNEYRTPRRKSKYTLFLLRRTSVEKYDFLIILRQIETNEQWFVVPVPVLLGSWDTAKKKKTFYIRDKKIPVYHNRYPKIEFWDYLDAWHLLQK